MFAPFIPFIVIFCQVIETRDQSDLERLHTFITSIKLAHTVSESATKMTRLFQALYGIARRYVDFRAANPEANPMQDATMESYLSSMGFLTTEQLDGVRHEWVTDEGPGQPGDDAVAGQGSTANMEMGANNTTRTGQRATNPMMWLGHGAQLEDWLYHNQAMMDILESSDDLYAEPGNIDR